MKVRITAAAQGEMNELPVPLRDALLDVLDEMATVPASLERSAVSLDPGDVDALDLPADAVAQAPRGELKAIGVRVLGGRRATAKPSVRVYFTTLADTLNVVAISTHDRAAAR